MTYLAVQNQWPSVTLPHNIDRAWFLGGFGLSTPYRNEDTLGDWAARTDDEIRNRLERYLRKNASLVVEQDVPVILDMEKPAHLIRLGKHLDRLDEVVTAFARRAEFSRELLPLAQTVWWGWAPLARGQTSTGYIRRMLGYWEAKERGLWSSADGMALILYPTEGDAPAVKRQITRAVVDAGEMLKGTDQLWPVISARARNGEPVTKTTIHEQISVIATFGLLSRTILWAKKADQALAVELLSA